jgi:two-component system, sensor histidine kinase and response regulator
MKGKILIVDDNPANLKTLTEFLKSSGYDIQVAEDGESALEQVGYSVPDIILLDVTMNGLNGFETCAEFKRRNVTRDVPILFMTAHTDTVDKVRGFAAGAVDYVTKPIEQEELLARIETHLMITRLQRQLQEENALKDRVMQLAAYELRSPLVSLTTGVEMLAHSSVGETARNSAPETVQALREAVWQMEAGVTQFLVNRLKLSGGLSLSKQTLDLNSIAKQAVAEARVLARAKGIHLAATFSDRLPGVPADEQSLRQVIRELISNALNSSAPMTQIEIRTSSNDTRAKLEIEHVLLRPGLVLDLVIARQLTSAQGGVLRETSVPDGKKSVMSLELPLAASSRF